MSASNVVEFFRTVAARADILDDLKLRSKDQVIAAAADLGFPFDEREFDILVWGLEVRLAEKRGEPFDGSFPLWQTMWGQYYLEYLALDLFPSFQESDFAAVLGQR